MSFMNRLGCFLVALVAVFTIRSAARAELISNLSLDNSTIVSGRYLNTVYMPADTQDAGILAGGATGASGRFGEAYNTQGAGSVRFNRMTNPSPNISNDFSVSLWIKSADFAQGNANKYLMMTGSQTWRVLIGYGDTAMYVFDTPFTNTIRNLAGTPAQTAKIPAAAMIANDWNNLIWTFNDTTNEFSSYLNGSLVGTVMVDIDLPDTSTQTLQVGASSLGDNWNGMLDDFAVFNHVLSSGEISSLQNNPAAAIPEPASLALLGAGSLFFGMVRRRRSA